MVSVSLSARACSVRGLIEMARVVLVLTIVLLTSPPTRSQCPPRDPQAQEEEGRLCAPPCAPDWTCRQTDKECMCDGPCGSVCLDPALRCPPPPVPSNGHVNVSQDTPIHSEANYICDQGFILVGAKIRRCRGDATWSGPIPTCQHDPFQCRGQSLFSSRPLWALLPRFLRPFYYNSETVPFICSRFARLSSGRQGTIKCVQGEWQRKKGECLPRTCPLIKEPLHGWIEVKDGLSAQFGCHEGFHLIGQSTAKCLAGEWLFTQGRPYCHSDEFEDDDVLTLEVPSSDQPQIVESTTQPSTETVSIQWEPVLAVLDPVPLVSKKGRCIVPFPPDVVIHESEQIETPNQHLVENGTRLIFSCPDTLRYIFTGSRQRTCQDGRWTGDAVSCSPVSPGVVLSPPGLVVRNEPRETDDLDTNDEGAKLVPAGSHLHIDCVWPRIPDNPDPEWAHPSPREQDAFQKGWDDRGERFTLSVWGVQEEDSGLYTCTPPLGMPHAVLIQVERLDQQLWSSTAYNKIAEEANSCLFKRSANIVAWSRGLWLNTHDQVPDQARVNLRCKDPGRYVLQGANLVTCLQGNWLPDIEGTVCQPLLRDSEYSPPPIEWHTSHPSAILHDGSILVPSGTRLTLDCLWVLAEPGHGWYHPVWVREGQQPNDRIQMPAEIVSLPGPAPSGEPLHFGYRLNVLLTPPKLPGQPLDFTCLTPSETRHAIRVYVTEFCRLSSASFPSDAHLIPSALQPVFTSGQSLPFLVPSCGVPSHLPCRQDGTWGPPPPCPLS